MDFKHNCMDHQNQWPACEKYAVNIVNDSRGTTEPTSTFINKSRIHRQMECTFSKLLWDFPYDGVEQQNFARIGCFFSSFTSFHNEAYM